MPHVVVQAIAAVGPAMAVLLTFQGAIQLAGINAPLVYLIDCIPVLLMGATLAQLARAFPSAGGYYTYVGRTIHPLAGFFTGWMYFLYSGLAPGIMFAFFARICQTAFWPYGVDIPWQATFLVTTAVTGVLLYRGVELSGRAVLIAGVVETVIVVAFSLWGFFRPHDGAISLAAFDPNGVKIDKLGLAAVFGILNYGGWESAAPLAEECEQPRRSIPIATVSAILFIGGLITVATWGLMLSWGAGELQGVLKPGSIPALILARRIWGPLWVLLLVAVANSVIGAGIGYSLVSSRMWFAMARDGVLPAPIARVHKRFQTPANATWAQIALTLLTGLGGATLVGIDNLYLTGCMVTVFASLFVYMSANCGLTFHMLVRARDELRPFRHVVLPTVSTLFLLAILYKSLEPFPSYPISVSAMIFIAWLVLWIPAAAVVVTRKRRGKLKLGFRKTVKL